MKRNIPHILFLAASISLGFQSTAAVGNLITLTDGSSVVTINPNSTGVRGVNYWSVNGAVGMNQLQQQWFWYRIGDSGPEASIDTLGNLNSGIYRGTRGAYVSYSDPIKNLNVEVDYLLTGGSPFDGKSDLGESITIKNTSTFSQTIHFFQYSNFDLQGVSSGDMLQFSLNSQSNKVNSVTQTKGLSSLTETVVTPPADHYEGNLYPGTLNRLNDGGPDTLSDLPVTPTTAGPGNMTWAFQWDMTLLPGGTFLISKDKRMYVDPVSFVPEPTSFALLGTATLGLLGFALRRRKPV